MTDRTNTQTRVFEFDLESRAQDSEGIPVVLSSDAIVPMPDGPEILMHTREAIDLSRAPLPIIAGHARNQVNVGIIDNLDIANGRLRGIAKFGERPEAAGYRGDVLNRTLRSVSAGYVRIRGTQRKDGVLVTTRWMPTHAAMVAEPADINAGFFRSLEAVPEFQMETEAAEVSRSTNPAQTAVKEPSMADDNAAAGTSAEPRVELVRDEQTAVQAEEVRIRTIENLCRVNSIDPTVQSRWVHGGASIDQVSTDLLAIFKSRGDKNKTVSEVGLTTQETRRYSLMRAIKACADQNWADAGFEAEASRAIGAKLGVVADKTKFYVPMEVQRREVHRDLTVASGSGGGFLVETANQSFIEILRNRSVAYRMGVTQLSGLVGSVTVPKQTAAATNFWLASESTAITESQQTFAQMALSPKTAGAYTEISRQLLLQSSPGAENLVTTDLAQVVALAVDSAVLSGPGSGGAPTGITATAGIGAFTGTTLGAVALLDAQADVAGANALLPGCGYVTTPTVAGLLMARPELPTTGTTRVWLGNMADGSIFGYPAMTSVQMASGTMLFGCWPTVVVAEWGTLAVEVNPYANFAAGIIGVRAMYSIDVGVRYAGAWSLASSIT